MMRFFRSAFVIARRDFAATVLSKTFIFFLLGPLFPLLFGGVFGGIGARVASRDRATGGGGDRAACRFRPLSMPRATELAAAIGEDTVVRLVGISPEARSRRPAEAAARRAANRRSAPS